MRPCPEEAHERAGCPSTTHEGQFFPSPNLICRIARCALSNRGGRSLDCRRASRLREGRGQGGGRRVTSGSPGNTAYQVLSPKAEPLPEQTRGPATPDMESRACRFPRPVGKAEMSAAHRSTRPHAPVGGKAGRRRCRGARDPIRSLPALGELLATDSPTPWMPKESCNPVSTPA